MQNIPLTCAEIMRSLFCIVAVSLATGFQSTVGQTFPSGFNRVLVANGIATPTAMAFSPDGRIFVCQQAGNVRIIKNNALLPSPFVSLSVNTQGERGLLGIAFDPDFSTNQFVYLYYTLQDGSRNRISRFTANGDAAIAGSEQVILDLDPLGAIVHNGGAMNFGPDGKLYVAIGENSVGSNAQNMNTYHGKLLRINPDGSIPEGNPFTDGSEQRRRIWALGLRNPFTFTFQRGTGKLYVNDVGAMLWEEIDDATTGGLNFGWPSNEGIVQGTTFTNPVYAYGHGSGDGLGCAITGGVFFNPPVTSYPAEYYGKYFFMDLCGAWINYIDPGPNATRIPFGTSIGNQAVGLAVSPDGNLYYLSRANNSLFRIAYTSTQLPVITNQPVSIDRFTGETATFSVSASGAQPLSYQWKKNGVDIPGATNIELAVENVSLSDEGQYSVSVSNTFGSALSAEATLTILGGNEPPVPSILTPVSGTMYRGGDVVQFSGTATDPEDGTIPAQDLSWQIVFHHGSHVHDSPPISGTDSGEFAIPTTGEVSDDVWYRLYLTARDMQGREATVFQDILPHTSQITLATVPPGLQLTLDGQTITSPYTFSGVEGILREIGVSSPQDANGTQYEFDHWEHGGEPLQMISTPEDNLTYTGIFQIITGNETDLENRLTIYPIPAKNHIVLNNVPESEIEILDLAGKVIHKMQVSGKTEQVKIEPVLDNGIYFIKIAIHDRILLKKIIVIR